MSRIQDILSKAERDGVTRRTRALHDDYAAPPPLEEPPQARAFVEPPRVAPAAEPPPRVPPLPHDTSHVLRALNRETLPPPPQPTVPSAPEPRARQAEPAAVATTEPVRVTTPPYADQPDPTPRAIAQLDPHLVAALAPTSLAAEQYRALRTRLKRAESGRALRAIAITSPNKGDGKTLTSANLALTMAQEFQQRVLLVDCDLRRPAVHQVFGLGDRIGLGEVLMNLATLDQALVWLPEYHLTVLPAGALPANPGELLGSATMRRALDTLRTRFDRILIDVPPVAPLADLQILAPMVDGLLMIVRAGITPKPAIERALAGLDTSKVLGLVLNESGTEVSDKYGYDGYGYIGG